MVGGDGGCTGLPDSEATGDLQAAFRTAAITRTDAVVRNRIRVSLFFIFIKNLTPHSAREKQNPVFHPDGCSVNGYPIIDNQKRHLF
jgi:hypothetical protein